MKEFFLKHKVVLFRVLGSLMLLVGFIIYFWTTPKEGISQNDIAAANVARMEARMKGTGGSSQHKPQSSSAKILEELKNTQKKQLEYMLILVMIFGVGFLIYSFVPKKKS